MKKTTIAIIGMMGFCLMMVTSGVAGDYIDQGNGTIREGNLVWTKSGDCGSPYYDSLSGSIDTFANGRCGVTDNSKAGDWRLPTVGEMQHRLRNATAPFTNVRRAAYWTSSDLTIVRSNWGDLGVVQKIKYIDRNSDYYEFWPVRTARADELIL